MQRVDRNAALGSAQSGVGVAVFEVGGAGAEEEVNLAAAELARVAVGPSVVLAVEGFAAPPTAPRPVAIQPRRLMAETVRTVDTYDLSWSGGNRERRNDGSDL